MQLFVEKWNKRGEGDMVAYLTQHILPHRFSRCHSFPGKPTEMCRVDTCALALGWGLSELGFHLGGCPWLRPLPVRVPCLG